MLEKFKSLSRGKKIIFGIIGLILLPITLVGLSIAFLVKGIKEKKAGQIVAGIVLTILSLSFASRTNFITKDYSTDIKSAQEIPSEEVSSKQVVSQDINVEIEESIEEDNGQVRFNIKTNLPDTTEFMVGLTELNGGDYRGQTNVIVSNGQAQTEWFSNKGESLRNGEYELSISMSLPTLQSEEVQKIVGVNGEYLKGEFVETDGKMSHISKTTTITLGGGVTTEEPKQEENYIVDNTIEMRNLINQEYLPLGNAITSIAEKVGNMEFYTEEDRMKILQDAVVIKLGAQNIEEYENNNPKYEQLDTYLKSGASSYKQSLDLILNIVDGDFDEDKMEKAVQLMDEGNRYTRLATEEIRSSGLMNY